MKRFIGVIIAIVIVFAFFVVRCSMKEPPKIFVVARDASWAPLALLDKAPNMTAFSDDLMFTIASIEKIYVDTVSGNTNTLFEGLEGHAYDGIFTSLIPPLGSNLLVSTNYFLLGPVIIVKEGSDVHSLQQLENHTVGVIRDAAVSFSVAKHAGINLITFDSPVDAIENLLTGNVDALIMDTLPAHSYVNKFYQGQIRVATQPLSKKGIHLITRNDPDSKKLMDAFNAGLQKIRQDGTYKELLRHWDLFNPDNGVAE